ncbi:MAG: hypothetical protein P4L46_15340 [Fimbriimonas sp.]|nr:hypothetical protein [Fimbriimonas sp.]
MRIFALSGLCLLTCLASAQDVSVHVTYTTSAARVAKVLSEIKALSHVDLQATRSTENEVLVVSVKDVPLSELLERIAKVTSCEWKHDGSTFRLVVAKPVQRREETTDLVHRIQLIRAAIQARAKGPTAGADIERGKSTPPVPSVPESPEEAIVTKLLLSVDPAVLADIAPGGRAVFSSNPTPTQHPFEAGVTGAIDDFIHVHNSSLANRKEDEEKQFSTLTAEQAAAIRNLTKSQRMQIGQVSKALLIATKLGLGVFNMTQLELRFYDAKGAVAYTASSMLSMPGDDLMALVSAVQGKKPAATSAKQTPIEYSEDSQALMKATKGLLTGNYSLKLPPDFKKRLVAPDKFDPLSYSASDEILSYAKAKGKPLVADIPDSASSGLAMYLPGEKTVESVEQDIAQGKTMVAVPDEKYTLLMPAQPAQERAERMDREALATILQKADSEGIPSLDDLAAYAQHAADPMEGGLNQMYLNLFVPGSTMQSMDGMSSWSMLRFYGRLSPAARASLIDGGKLPIGNFDATEKGCLESMTYGAMHQLQVNDSQDKASSQPYWMKLIGGNTGSDYRDEPTESVPSGLPPTGYLEMKASTQPFASPIPAEGTRPVASMATLGSDELAIFRMFKQDKNYAQIAAMLPSLGNLRIGQRTVYTFTFHLNPIISIQQSLKDHHLPKDATVVTESTLPDDLEKQVQAKLADFKKSPLGALGALMGGGRQAIRP